MKKQENSNLWLADDGKTFVQKSDGFVMGTGIDLGENDTIENYEEVELTEENDVEGILKRKAEMKARRKESHKKLID